MEFFDQLLNVKLVLYIFLADLFSVLRHASEALYRISEIYYSIGMFDESTKTVAILGYNYPKSEWYKFGYNNLSDDDKKNSIFSNPLRKIFNK